MSDQVQDLIKEAEKRLGEGALKFGKGAIKKVPMICSSGSYKLDLALGCGGIPQGRIIEYYGPPSGGKTTLALHTMKECQIKYPDKKVAFIDLENSFDREWATNLGINCDEVLFSTPDTGEETYSLIDLLIKSGIVSFVVIDSVSGMITNAQVDAEPGDATMAQVARLMSQNLPKVNNALKHNFCSVLFINQVRSKIGGYGNPEDTQGGNALKFWASIRNEVRRGEVIGDKTAPVGFITKIKNTKNKVGHPFRIVETELYIGPEKFGIDKFVEVVDLAVVNNIISKGGAWYKYLVNNQEERFQGKESLINFLRQNKTVYEEIWNQVEKTVLVAEKPITGSFNDVQEKLEEETQKKRKSKKDKIIENNFEELLINNGDNKEGKILEEENKE